MRPLPCFNGCGYLIINKYLTALLQKELKLDKATAFFTSNRKKYIDSGKTIPAPGMPPKFV